MRTRTSGWRPWVPLVDADASPTLDRALDRAHTPTSASGAAKALARHGDPKALAPLVALATAPEPREPERQKEWVDLTESALDGLGELGDPAALPQIIPLLDSKHAALRLQAARALTWCSPGDTLGALRQALQHDDPEVKYHAALGLAYAGDAAATALVFASQADKFLNVDERLAAALALGDARGRPARRVPGRREGRRSESRPFCCC